MIAPDDTEYRFDKEVADANWYRTDDYDLITIQRPLEGEWQVIADLDPDSRVTVVSNLNLLVKPLPTNLFSEQSVDLSVLFQEKGKTVTDGNFLRLLSIEGDVDHSESGEHWDKPLSDGEPPANGIYSASLDMFQQEGRYQVAVQVDGKSFQRQFKHNITVRQPFAVSLDKQVNGGREEYVLSVRAHGSLVDPANTQVVARIKDPKGRSSIKPLSLTPKDEWEYTIQPEEEGRYQVRLRIDGTDKNGEEFRFDPGTQSFQFPSEDNPFAQFEEPDPVQEEPVQPEPAVEEPEPVAEEPEPEVTPEPEPEEPVEEEEESSSWPLYVGLGVGNLLIIVLAVFAYRMVMGSGKGDSLKELEEAVAEAESESDEAVKEEATPEPQPDPEPEPEVAAPEMQAISEVEPIEEEMAMEDMPMDDGLDLSSDDVTEADLPVDDEQTAEELLAGLEEPEGDLEGAAEDAEASDALEGFSLDDFAPDSLDDDLADGDSEEDPNKT